MFAANDNTTRLTKYEQDRYARAARSDAAVRHISAEMERVNDLCRKGTVQLGISITGVSPSARVLSTFWRDGHIIVRLYGGVEVSIDAHLWAQFLRSV